MAHPESLVISPAAMPRAGPGAGSATHGMGVQWEPGFLVWGGERELEKTFKGQHCREQLAEGAFHMDSAYPPAFGSQVAAHGPARLRPGRDCKVTEGSSSGPQVQAGLARGPHTHISGCTLKKYELPRWLSGKESACQFRRREFNPWVGKVLCRRKRQPTPVFLPGKLHGQRSLVG